MMSTQTATAARFVEGLLTGQGESSGAPLAWLRALRSEALERANALAVPTTHDEDWRFTDLSPFYKLAFRPAPRPGVIGPDDVGARLGDADALRLVFLDGVYAPKLSVAASDTGVAILPLAQALQSHGDLVQERLGRIADFRSEVFGAVNTAWLADGAFVHVARNREVARPVHLLFVSTQAEVAVHPRVLVVAEAGSEVTVLEDYVSLHDATYWVNTVGEIHVGQNARVRHVTLQRAGRSAFHIGTSAVRVARDGKYLSNAVSLGARISRNNVHVVQGGEGIEVQLDGLALVGGRQLADTHTFMDHALPHGTSRQLHKCVVAGGAHAVFNGRVLVREGAQRTDSAQESRNLLLSEKARVDTKPQLEIFADDVKCSHGAAVGQLEAEELFYLRTRGLGETAARNLLTYGFAAEIVARIPLPWVVNDLRGLLLAQTGAEELQ
jgi:Fe-S cluster assembly protein SufD